MNRRPDPALNRYCSRPWKQVTVLSDGTAVCACIDAGKSNPLGNVKDQGLDGLWNGPDYVRTRRQILEDIDQIEICRACPNRTDVPPADPVSIEAVPLPRALFLESVAACNLACPGCDRESIEGTRTGLVLDTATMKRTIDQLSPGLEYFEYHVGGENFMHKDSCEVIRYAKDRNPGAFILSSTNGHFFRTPEEQRAVVDSGIDCLIFSIDGTTQESYERYRAKGDLQRALDGMQGVLDVRNSLGLERPFVVWRYILFAWNDSPEEMDRARAMAREIGVDFFCWHLNAVKTMHSSQRYYIGSERNHEIQHELWDEVQKYCPVDLEYERY